MSYGYGNGNNPYAQRDDTQPRYGVSSPRYGGPTMGRDEYDGSNVEMEPLTGTGNSFPRQEDPRPILAECKKIGLEIKDIRAKIGAIDKLQVTILNSPNGAGTEKDLREAAMNQFIDMYEDLTKHYTRVNQMPGSASSITANQLKRIGGKKEYKDSDPSELESVMSQYQAVLNKYTDGLKQQAERQYLIVNPDASREEVYDAVENSDGQQMFSQAIMQSNRQGQAQTALNAVAQRNQEIKQIESQMIELAGLFEQMGQMVEQQEAAVTNIEMKGEEVVDNMKQGTEQIGVAIESARNTRKWKWWCLGIVVLIIIVIVVIVLIYKFVIQTPATTTVTAKRFILTDSIPASRFSTAGHAVVPGKDFKPASKLAIPGLAWKDDRLVVPGADYIPGSRRSKRFQA